MENIKYGEAAKVGRRLKVTKQAASKGIKSGLPKYLDCLAQVRNEKAKRIEQAKEKLKEANRRLQQCEAAN